MFNRKFKFNRLPMTWIVAKYFFWFYYTGDADNFTD